MVRAAADTPSPRIYPEMTLSHYSRMGPEQLRMVISRGDDWSSQWQAILDTYSSTDPSSSKIGPWVFRDRKGELTTKAVNIYRGQHRGFDYLTPKLRIEADDLVEDDRLPEGIHFVCSPDRAEVITKRVDAFVAQGKGAVHGLRSGRPVLCWEPIADSAVVSSHPTVQLSCMLMLPKFTARESRRLSEAAEICRRV